ncbi:hypothetical protein MLD38_033636 [Melastoma candidum]|uniref:Uncharacterized protein n=1 Tax=Melastoma candidum TaxID=119954 RepID=A0ACB9M7J3_9MYRT|nr:hypothetical protein MLD38_033636 [Melastoma candidum]
MTPSSNNNNNHGVVVAASAGGRGGGGHFGDTTYTKVFVGGLAWETHKDTMKKYFEQFGEILEAVVITDKATGRSKGYGFVTFREADAAMRACVDASPVIDGRRANCNLASLGLQRSKPSTPKHGGGGGGTMRSLRVMSGFQSGFGASAFPSSAANTFPHYAIQQGIPFNVYGYSHYSLDYSYPPGYYGMYGAAAAAASAQYPMYGSGANTVMSSATTAAYYPYLHLGEAGSSGGNGYTCGFQYPHHLFPYSTAAMNSTAAGYPAHHHHYASAMSLAHTPAIHSGVTMALHAPIPHR